MLFEDLNLKYPSKLGFLTYLFNFLEIWPLLIRMTSVSTCFHKHSESYWFRSSNQPSRNCPWKFRGCWTKNKDFMTDQNVMMTEFLLQNSEFRGNPAWSYSKLILCKLILSKFLEVVWNSPPTDDCQLLSPSDGDQNWAIE